MSVRIKCTTSNLSCEGISGKPRRGVHTEYGDNPRWPRERSSRPARAIRSIADRRPYRRCSRTCGRRPRRIRRWSARCASPERSRRQTARTPDGCPRAGLVLRQFMQLEEVRQMVFGNRPARFVPGVLHPGRQMPRPQMLRDARMGKQIKRPVQEEPAVIGQSLQARHMVGVQMRQHDSVYVGGVESHACRKRSLPHHLADGVGAVDEQPAAFGLQGQASGVGNGRKGVANPQ